MAKNGIETRSLEERLWILCIVGASWGGRPTGGDVAATAVPGREDSPLDVPRCAKESKGSLLSGRVESVTGKKPGITAHLRS